MYVTQDPTGRLVFESDGSPVYRESTPLELPALTTLPEDGQLYAPVESTFNVGSMSMDHKLAKCKMCGAAISGDEDALKQHKQFHVDLLTFIESFGPIAKAGNAHE